MVRFELSVHLFQPRRSLVEATTRQDVRKRRLLGLPAGPWVLRDVAQGASPEHQPGFWIVLAGEHLDAQAVRSRE